jgi:hypothetical protein
MKYIVFISIILVSCARIYNKTSLDIDMLDPNNRKNSLALHGYYYTSDSDHITPMLLYSNGYMYEMYTYKMEPAVFEMSTLTDPHYFNRFNSSRSKHNIGGWGIWWVQKDSLFIEQYVNVSGNYALRYRKGLIQNDSTFVITSDFSDFQRPKLRAEQKTYQFRTFKQKPDSINYLQQNIKEFGKR